LPLYSSTRLMAVAVAGHVMKTPLNKITNAMVVKINRISGEVPGRLLKALQSEQEKAA